MRPNKDRRTEIILYGLLLIPLLFAAAALAQATEQAQGLAEITAALSTILNNPMALKWCASTPKFLLAVLVLYPLAVYCYVLDQADRHPGAEHGTAKWGSAHRLNIKYRNTKDPKENYILTENVRFSTDSHAHKHNLNIIVIGGSGSGKTRFYVKPNALQLIGSYLFLDPKGELTRTLGRIMETKGISVTVLDLVHFQGHYNPMAYLETDEDAIKLAFAIVNNTKPKDAPSGGDKFWDDSSVLLISALILYLMYEAPASEQNFSTLMYMILNCQVSENEMVENPLMMLFGELERRDPQHPAVLQFKSFMLGAKKTLQSILISAAANLYIHEDEVCKLMSEIDKCSMPEQAIVLSLLNTGVRRAELAGLTWSDFDFKECTVHVNKSLLVFRDFGYQHTATKESNDRYIDVAPEYMEFMQQYKEWWYTKKRLMGASWQRDMVKNKESKRESLMRLAGEEFVIIDDFGWPRNPDGYNALVKRVAKKAGLKDIHPHMFRHTFVSLLMSNPDIGVATVAAEAGHAQPSTTLMIYTQQYKKRRESIRNQLSRELYEK